jgi:hypothetical protein
MVALACFAAFICTPAARAAAASKALAIVGATVIDLSHGGSSTDDRPDSVVLLRDGLISEVGSRSSVPVPHGARIIDGRGMFLVPGLIDGFGSLRSRAFADAYLFEGVTSVLVNLAPVGADGEQEIFASAPGETPTLIRAATIVTARPRTSGHGGATIAEEVERLAKGGNQLLTVGQDLTPPQVREVVAFARTKGLGVAGILAATRYAQAAAEGVDTLFRIDHYLTALAQPSVQQAYASEPNGRAAAAAHRAACSTDPDSRGVTEFGEQLARAHVAVMPMLSIEATADDVGAPNPWVAPAAAFVDPADLDDPVDPVTGARPYLVGHPSQRDQLRACALQRQAIQSRLHRMGLRHLAGSGAPAYGILPGSGLHQELRLLQAIGLTPRQSLAAATSNFADHYAWLRAGRVAAGRKADLLLVGSDPRVDVSALEDIRVVIHGGRVVDRIGLLQRAYARHRACGAAQPARVPGRSEVTSRLRVASC